MQLTRGLNHVAVLTEDVDRFVEFYTTVFDVEVVFTESTPTFRHAIRDRLIARGATDGTIEDLGAFHSLWFTDPDGMSGELTLIGNADLAGIHAPVPVPSR